MIFALSTMILKMTVRLNGNFKGGPMPTPSADLHDSDGIFPRCHDFASPQGFVCCFGLVFDGERAQSFEVTFT